MNAVTPDYVEPQLKAGLPYARKQLYCQVNVAAAAGNPWKHLLDHRFANVKDFKQGQRYLGRVIMLQPNGAVPDIWEGWEAPAKLFQQLVEGKVTEINFEQVDAELCRAQSRPLPPSGVASFTTPARYMDPAWQRADVKPGGKILTAWGLNSELDLVAADARRRWSQCLSVPMTNAPQMSAWGHTPLTQRLMTPLAHETRRATDKNSRIETSGRFQLVCRRPVLGIRSQVPLSFGAHHTKRRQSEEDNIGAT